MKYQDIKSYAETYAVPIMRPKTSDLIAEFVQENKPKNILEIGTAIGYSGVVMLENSEANLITIEHNTEYIKKAKEVFKTYRLEKRVKILSGDCLVILANLAHNEKYRNYFDIIFLDGPKAQYDLLLEGLIKLLSPNGTLIVDNVLFRGYVANSLTAPTKRYKTIIKRLNTFIDNCKNNPNLKDFNLINTEDGIITAKKVNNEK